MKEKAVVVTAMSVMLIAGVAYLLFLAYTWQQLQHDRSTRYAKVDEILDRLNTKTEPEGFMGG